MGCVWWNGSTQLELNGLSWSYLILPKFKDEAHGLSSVCLEAIAAEDIISSYSAPIYIFTIV